MALALIAALPALVAAILAALNRRDLKTPSGMTIGYVAERGHDLAALAASRPSMRIDSALTEPEREPNVTPEPPEG